MTHRGVVRVCILAIIVVGLVVIPGASQEDGSDIHVIVNLVQLNVAVTDNKGNYVTGLRPEDFDITEDGIREKLATFGEGDEPTRRLVESAPNSNADAHMGEAIPGLNDSSITETGESLKSLLAGSNVFVLFDTSNYMYRGFVFAQDAIADFIRSLQ